MANEKASVTDLKQTFANRADNLNKLLAPPKSKSDPIDPKFVKSLNKFSSANQLLSEDLSSLKKSLDKLVVALTPKQSFRAKIDQQSITNDYLKTMIEMDRKRDKFVLENHKKEKNLFGPFMGGIGKLFKIITNPLALVAIGGFVKMMMSNDFVNFVRASKNALGSGGSDIKEAIRAAVIDKDYSKAKEELKSVGKDMKKEFMDSVPEHGALNWAVKGRGQKFIHGASNVLALPGTVAMGVLKGEGLSSLKTALPAAASGAKEAWDNAGETGKRIIAGAILVQAARSPLVQKAIVNTVSNATSVVTTKVLPAATNLIKSQAAKMLATRGLTAGAQAVATGGAYGEIALGGSLAATPAATGAAAVGAVALPALAAAVATTGGVKVLDAVTNNVTKGIYKENKKKGIKGFFSNMFDSETASMLADEFMTGGKLADNRRALQVAEIEAEGKRKVAEIIARKKQESGGIAGTPAASNNGNVTNSNDIISELSRTLKVREGMKLERYWDVDAYSVGYGHHITNDATRYVTLGGKKIDLNKTRLTPAMADELFRQDLIKNVEFAKKFPNWNLLTKDQQIAIADMTYNMGPGWLSWSSIPGLSKALLDKDWQTVNNTITSWKYHKDVTDRANANIAKLTENNYGNNTPSNSTIAQTESQKSNPEIHLSDRTMEIFGRLFGKLETGDVSVNQTVAAAGAYD